MEIVETYPGEENYELFEQVVVNLYEESSPRFKFGNEPVSKSLLKCYVILNEGMAVGRLAFYANEQLKYNGEKAAAIGSYECVDHTDTSMELLNYAKNIAVENGCTWLIGPMEGSTWNNYRFSLHNDERNFFLEPFHYIYYNEQFKNAGFEPIAEFYSALDRHLDFDSENHLANQKIFEEQELIFRNLNKDDLSNELKKIGQFSIESFAHNFLYTPITTSEFLEKYNKIEPLIDPELVWLAEDNKGSLVGLAFSIKDFSDVSGKTIIIKSLARKRNSAYSGLGRHLSELIINSAVKLGYENIIHAFMKSDNASLRISKDQDSKSYKKYALYGMKLNIL